MGRRPPEMIGDGFIGSSDYFVMKIVNAADVEELEWHSPNGRFSGFGKQLSEALGREPRSTDLLLRHPFDVELARLAPGQTPFPFHSHSAQWEFYYVVSGNATVRHDGGATRVKTSDAFLFKPGEAHTFTNDGTEDFVYICVADNPIGESAHYPDSNKWSVYSPQRRIMRGEALDYFDGEE